LEKIRGEWIVKAVASFTFNVYLCSVMEYMPGGDLLSAIERESYFDEPDAKFYIAQIVLAIECLHQQGMIHRDLKPDNILVDANGYAKLADFGLSVMGFLRKKPNMPRRSVDTDVSQRIVGLHPQLEKLSRSDVKHSVALSVPEHAWGDQSGLKPLALYKRQTLGLFGPRQGNDSTPRGSIGPMK
jgi:serine/threonine protein kinase